MAVSVYRVFILVAVIVTLLNVVAIVIILTRGLP